MKTTQANRKRHFEKVVSLNLTFAPTIMQTLEELIRRGGYKGPVEYFSARVRVGGGLEPSIQPMIK